MLNIFQIFRAEFSQVIHKIAQEKNITITENDLKNFTVEPSKERVHGDLACNIAMILCKKFQSNPNQLAKLIIENFSNQNVEKFEIAGAGFINIFLKNNIYYEILKSINSCDEIKFPNIGNNLKINLEYASPNPTGPIHVGHTRGAIYGDVLAKLLQKVGYDVLKEYYINDAGGQINTLLKSAYYRYLEAIGQQIQMPEGLYPGEYLQEIGKKIQEKFADKLREKTFEEYSPLIRDLVVNSMLDLIKDDLK